MRNGKGDLVASETHSSTSDFTEKKARFNRRRLMRRFLSALFLGPSVLFIIYLGGWPFLAMTLLFAVIAAYEWIGLRSASDNFLRHYLVGFLYLGAAFGSFYMLREAFDFTFAFFFCVLVWGSDVGAYFTGKIFGGAKMAEKISPNKTWAGFYGAMGLPAMLSLGWPVLAFMVDGGISPEWHTFLVCVIGGMLVGVAGQIGDLMISSMKRTAGVKDTGKLIPGHGGLLDRIDSMLFAAPLFFAIVWLVFYGVS